MIKEQTSIEYQKQLLLMKMNGRAYTEWVDQGQSIHVNCDSRATTANKVNINVSLVQTKLRDMLREEDKLGEQ